MPNADPRGFEPDPEAEAAAEAKGEAVRAAENGEAEEENAEKVDWGFLAAGADVGAGADAGADADADSVAGGSSVVSTDADAGGYTSVLNPHSGD